MTGYDIQEAANAWFYHHAPNETGPLGMKAAFAAGAAWQKERDNLMPATPEFDHVKAYQAILAMLQAINEHAGRGADRGVAILKHLQEIGDNVRGVSGAIGDRFGVVLDAVKDVGEKVEACMTIASNTEEGLSVSIEKLDKLGVEKWREAIKHVEAEGITEPMHAEVKAEPVIIESNPEAPGDWVKSAFMRGKVKAADYDESGLGKLWADVTVNLEDVSDETLDDLHRSEQIGTARYVEERGRRIAEKIDLGDGLAPRVDHAERSYAAKMRMGVDLSSGPDKSALVIKGGDGEVKFMGATDEQFAVVELSSGAVVILWEGKPYLLRGMDLHPLRFVA